MTKHAIVLLSAAACLGSAPAFAQEGLLRSVGVAAFAAARDSDSGLGNAQGLRNVMIESPDEGGGGMGLHGGERQGGSAADTADESAPATSARDETTTPGAATPKRPTYRWQSLVPGAIK